MMSNGITNDLGYDVIIETEKGVVKANISKIEDIGEIILQHPNYTAIKVQKIDKVLVKK